MCAVVDIIMAKKRMNRNQPGAGAVTRMPWRVAAGAGGDRGSVRRDEVCVGCRYSVGCDRRYILPHGLVAAPERTVTNPDLEEVEVLYGAMTISFNPGFHVPNWVGWELTRDKAEGSEPRADRFTRDDNVRGCAWPEDYRGSGYDRGHMAPAADMKWDGEAMHKSFMLTNVCPQESTQLNAGAWKKLEEKCRLWAQADSVIYIVAGPVLTDTVLTPHIGGNGVAVPSCFFKVSVSPLRRSAARDRLRHAQRQSAWRHAGIGHEYRRSRGYYGA